MKKISHATWGVGGCGRVYAFFIRMIGVGTLNSCYLILDYQSSIEYPGLYQKYLFKFGPMPDAELAKTDTDSRRATYGLDYPTLILPLKNKNEYKTEFGKNNISHFKFLVHAKKLDIQYSIGTIEATSFSQCSFFIDGKEENIIKRFTFRDCKFSNCFLGTIEYEDVKFENCEFEKSDFMHSRFINCSFSLCRFNGCTSISANFKNTELDSKAFIQSSKEFKNILTNEGIDSDVILSRVRLLTRGNYEVAKSLYISNLQVGNSNYIDRSLYAAKKTEIEFLLDAFKYPSQQDTAIKQNLIIRIYKRPGLIIPIVRKGLNLLLTKGGTSLSRLLWLAFIIILIFNSIFQQSKINSTIFNIWQPSNLKNFIRWFPLTISDFLGFGYTSFITTNTKELFELTLCTVLGLLWYALLIPIIIRKIYR